jgi:hypothetical protein
MGASAVGVAVGVGVGVRVGGAALWVTLTAGARASDEEPVCPNNMVLLTIKAANEATDANMPVLGDTNVTRLNLPIFPF